MQWAISCNQAFVKTTTFTKSITKSEEALGNDISKWKWEVVRNGEGLWNNQLSKNLLAVLVFPKNNNSLHSHTWVTREYVKVNILHLFLSCCT